MTRVLIVSHDIVGPNMAGPGIRYWEMASALARQGFNVTLAAPEGSSSVRSPASRGDERPAIRASPTDSIPAFDVPILSYGTADARLAVEAGQSDALLVTGPILEQFPALVRSDRPIVVDLYDPFLFENLHRLRDTARAWPEYLGGKSILAAQIGRGDYFICANERQRDLYRGMLTAWGRINPTTYASDPTLDSLLGVVPFGVSTDAPRAGVAARGQIPGIDADSQLIVWNGGIWDWFDPLTAIDAVDRVRNRFPLVRLLFLGTRHPNLAIGEPQSARAARARARELGTLDVNVFFRDWTPYGERGAFLREADIAISLHVPGIETRFSSRTRLLDCIWAGIPFVTSEGDIIGDALAGQGLATVTPCGDIAAVSSAIERMLETPDRKSAFAPAFAALAETLSWDNVIAPLVAFLRTPKRAADREPPDDTHARASRSVQDRLENRRSTWEGLLRHLAERDQTRVQDEAR